MTGLRQQAPMCNFMKIINQYPIMGDNLKKETEAPLTLKSQEAPFPTRNIGQKPLKFVQFFKKFAFYLFIFDIFIAV